MAALLVATDSGCRVFSDSREPSIELAGRQVYALAREAGGACLGALDGQEIWRRDAGGAWSKAGVAGISLQSIVSVGGTIFAGGMDEAVMVRIPANARPERLSGFDLVPGRNQWAAGGPPLGVRSLTATADGSAILAGVHVGGIPRSVDRGENWTPTIPVNFDVHEVRAHPSKSNVVAAAAAVGLCLSNDGGRNWNLITQGLDLTNSLAVAVLEDDVLFSIQDGAFAKRSQVWRCPIGERRAEQLREGLPEWLDGKVDTAHIAAAGRHAAILDGGGNLWLSKTALTGWERIAAGLPYAWGLLML